MAILASSLKLVGELNVRIIYEQHRIKGKFSRQPKIRRFGIG